MTKHTSAALAARARVASLLWPTQINRARDARARVRLFLGL